MGETSTSALIIRLDAIGDALMLAPLLAALRQRRIPVDLVMTKSNARIFAARAMRDVFVAPFPLRSSGRRNVAAIRGFAAEIAPRGYTDVLVASEDPAAYRLARDTHAPHRVGFSNTGGKPLKRIWVAGMLTRTIARTAGLDASAPHECAVLFALGRRILGDEARPTRSPEQLRPLLLDREPLPDERVVFQITDKWRRLGIGDDAVLAAIASARSSGHRLRLVAPASETAYARDIATRAGENVDCFDDLEPWKDAIAAARAVVAPDSGAVHVAGMLGTPVVAVFAEERAFALQAARWAPWAAPHRTLEATGGWPLRANDALNRLIAADKRASVQLE